MTTHHKIQNTFRLLLAGFALAGSGWVFAQAATYPNRPVQFVIPGTVGGGTYVVARLFSDRYQQVAGQPAVLMTAPGASGIVGVQKVATSKPDGYTVLFGFNQLVTMNPHLLPGLPYDVERDLKPVSLLAEAAYVWLAHTTFTPNTVPEWIAFAKANPKRISYATSGSGSAANLGAELFMSLTNTEMLQVPYKGDPTVDLLSGIVHLRMEPYATALTLLRTGRVKALAVTGSTRLASLPNVPAMSEYLTGYSIPVTYSVWVPAATPRPVIEKLHADLAKIAAMPEVAERLSAVSVRVVGSSPEELLAGTRNESQQWKQLITKRNIKVEP
jgi:tripartite-type tricarboxylate transporter receptor subunit TctC